MQDFKFLTLFIVFLSASSFVAGCTNEAALNSLCTCVTELRFESSDEGFDNAYEMKFQECLSSYADEFCETTNDRLQNALNDCDNAVQLNRGREFIRRLDSNISYMGCEQYSNGTDYSETDCIQANSSSVKLTVSSLVVLIAMIMTTIF